MMETKNKAFICLVLCLPICLGVPIGDMVVTTDANETPVKPEATTTDVAKEGSTDAVPTVPKIYEMNIKSNVSNRFAHTTLTSKVKNIGTKSQETTFFVVLPDSAYIAGFIMEISGKNYTAYVSKKEDAQRTYDQAVESGISAAHVAVSARDSNKFTVNMNIEPESKAIFYLIYEELLERKDGTYELIINIHPKQLVKDLSVEVEIDESSPLKFVKAPPLRSGNEIGKDKDELDPRATIQKNANKATVKFSPDYERQKQIAQSLGTKEEEGIAGQFVVQYDVERDSSGGQILLKDGYFVHFFAPDDLPQLHKHIVFVLDTSGSMYEPKLGQLKMAMRSILGELNSNDTFNLVEFNSNAKAWNLDAPSESTEFPEATDYWNSNKFNNLSGVSFAPAYPVNPKNIEKANNAVKDMFATGGTNIYEALRVAIHLVKLSQQRTGNSDRQPLIVFLTDGDPTVGITDQKLIISGISEENLIKIPIFSLSFGNGADRKFLQKISLNNYGFARHIYEDSDATIQLEKFYQEISSPSLNNVKFAYTPDVTSLTKTEFPIYFRGAEHVVAGKIPDLEFKGLPQVTCIGISGLTVFKPTIVRSVGQLERLWAYMTVKKYLDAKEASSNGSAYDTLATDLALKYSFVTPVTSLVVVKPNATSAVDTEAADKAGDLPYPSFAASGGISYLGSGLKLSSLPTQNYMSAPRMSIGGQIMNSISSNIGAGITFNSSISLVSDKPLDLIDFSTTLNIQGTSGMIPAIPQSAIAYQPAMHYPTTPFSYSIGAPAPSGAGGAGGAGIGAGIGASGSFGGPTGFAAPAAGYPGSYSPPVSAENEEPDFDNDRIPEMEEATTEQVPIVPATLPPTLKKSLAWLEAFLNPDGTLNFFKGKFTLGYNETSPANMDCTDPESKEGNCKLIQDCEVLHTIIKDEKTFKDYFCAIDKFAGVCCPKK